MCRIDQTDIGRTRTLVPRCGGLDALSVLRRGDDDEILRFQFFEDCLPT